MERVNMESDSVPTHIRRHSTPMQLGRGPRRAPPPNVGRGPLLHPALQRPSSDPVPPPPMPPPAARGLVIQQPASDAIGFNLESVDISQFGTEAEVCIPIYTLPCCPPTHVALPTLPSYPRCPPTHVALLPMLPYPCCPPTHVALLPTLPYPCCMLPYPLVHICITQSSYQHPSPSPTLPPYLPFSPLPLCSYVIMW